jgi:LacI family transcriptional regulator
MRAIFEAGLSIPRDIAIIGAANMHYSDILRVPLSTVDQCTTQMGEQAAALLLACMTSKGPQTPRQVIVPPRLIVRSSSDRRGGAAPG